MVARAGRGVVAEPTTALVDVAGLAVLVQAEQASDLALVQRLVGERTTDRPPDAVIRIGALAPPKPARAPDFEGPYGDHWDDGDRHEFWHHWGLGASVDAASAVLGGPAAGHARWVAVRNSMLFVLSRLFYERGRFVLHGAAIRRDHTAFLAVGDSGTGKSTLAFAASRAGWAVLGDDMVVVESTPDGVIVQGIPRVPSIPGEVARLTGAAGDRLPDDDRDRVELVGFALDTAPASVTGVLICEHGSKAGSVRRVTHVDALTALVPAFVLSALETPVQRWFPVAATLGQGPAIELRHASKASRRLDETGGLLGRAIELSATG